MDYETLIEKLRDQARLTELLGTEDGPDGLFSIAAEAVEALCQSLEDVERELNTMRSYFCRQR